MPKNTPEIRTLFAIYEKIRAIGDEEILHGDSGVIEPAYRGLDELCAREIDEDMAARLLALPELQTILPSISRLRNLYGLRLEIEQAERLLAAPDPWAVIEGFTFYENYCQLAAMEQRGAGLAAGDSIVFLGCGPLPLSLIMLCSTYRLSGIGIERQRPLADLARRLVNHLGMDNRLRIMDGDHFSLPVETNSKLTMVAAMARPKGEIFAHLAGSLPEGSLVSYRLYERGWRRVLDLEEPFEMPEEFTIHSRLRPRPPVNNTIVVMRHGGSVTVHQRHPISPAPDL